MAYLLFTEEDTLNYYRIYSHVPLLLFVLVILGIYGFGRLILIFVDIKLTQFAQASLEYEQNQAIYDNSENNY